MNLIFRRRASRLVVFVAAIFVLSANAMAQNQQVYQFSGQLNRYVVSAGVTRLTIRAVGAVGGRGIPNPGYAGGKLAAGASMQGEFAVTPGETLSILVGGAGQGGQVGNGGYGSIAGGGGGGASAVWRGPNLSDLTQQSVLIVAGGGGGQGSYEKNGKPGRPNETSGDTSCTQHEGCFPGGTNGQGGGADFCSGGGGGGGGLIGSGTQGGKGSGPGTFQHTCWAIGNGGQGGGSLQSGGVGGNPATGGSAYDGIDGHGGFGGGGGASAGAYFGGGCGGGGGGYSGGTGGTAGGDCGGGGGGSFNGGVNQVNAGGIGTGNGQVIITILPPAS